MDKITLELGPTQKVFISSDPHYGHKNIITFCKRPFADLKEMHKTLIDNWNSVVADGDIVYLLGDINWSKSSHELNRILRQLKGQIGIIPGNHDATQALRALPSHCVLLSDIVHLWAKINEISYSAVLSHYPLVTWMGRERGVINLHGHIHSSPYEHDGYDATFSSPQHYDIGVDNNNFTPIELIKIPNLCKKEQ